jgi:hypothetical protein
MPLYETYTIVELGPHATEPLGARSFENLPTVGRSIQEIIQHEIECQGRFFYFIDHPDVMRKLQEDCRLDTTPVALALARDGKVYLLFGDVM